MERLIDLLLMMVVLLGLLTLVVSRVDLSIRVVAIQGFLLGALVWATHSSNLTVNLIFFALLSVAVKGIVVPWLLGWSMREANVQKELQPYVGFTYSLVLGAIALGLAFGLSNFLHLPNEAGSRLMAPASLATVFIGLLLLVSRRLAVSQVVGYVVLENGIFVFGLSVAAELPLIVEMGVLLDLFVGVFIMGIVTFQIDREFDHTDTSRLHGLQDVVTGSKRWPFGSRKRR